MPPGRGGHVVCGIYFLYLAAVRSDRAVVEEACEGDSAQKIDKNQSLIRTPRGIVDRQTVPA